MHTSPAELPNIERNAGEVCTKLWKYAHFPDAKKRYIEILVESVHETREMCTLWRSKKNENRVEREENMKSYIKFLSRNKLYTAIEAVGLTISLAFVILIGTYVWQQYGIAYENPDHGRIFIVSDENTFGLGYYDKEDLETSIPEVEVAARYSIEMEEAYCIDGKTHLAIASKMDKEFFDIFPYYKILKGSPELLDDRSNVFVSRRFANIISEDGSDVVGKQIYNHYEPETVYTIAGIVEDFDQTLFIYSDLIFGVYDEYFEGNARNSARYGNIGNYATFFRVAEGTSRDELFAKLKPMFTEHYNDWVTPVMRDLDEVYFYDGAYMTHAASKSMLRLLLIVVVALLVSAVINYVNLTFAQSGRRAREMATRRLVGAQKNDVFLKSILESVAFTLVCLIAAVILAFAFVPAINSLLVVDFTDDIALRVPLSLELTPGYLCIWIAAAVALGSIAGLMPAFNAVRFKPIDIIKGSFRMRDKMVFSKVFIVVQNVLSVVLVALAVLMEVQLAHMIQRPMNANMENLYHLRQWELNVQSGQPLIDRLLRLPEVKEVGVGSGYPGGMNMGFGMRMNPDEPMVTVQTIICDTTFFRLMNPQIVSDFKRPLKESVWLGESTAAALNYCDSLDALIAGKFNGMNGSYVTHVGGMFKDIPVANAATIDSNPNCAFVLQSPEYVRYNFGLLISTYDESPQTRKKIMDEYDAFAEEAGIYNPPFISTFLSDTVKQSLSHTIQTIRLVELFMILSVLLSLLGLVAMSTYFSEQKSKEIAVRKVFGGTIWSETLSNVRSYMVMVLVASVIGVPIAVYAAGRYLEQFAYRIENYWWIFLVAVLLSFAISLLSVLWQTLKAARTNPATELKKE